MVTTEELTFRNARMDDVDRIMEMIRLSIKCMRTQGIDQWDEIYPCADDFSEDILRGEAYVGFLEKKMVSIYTINTLFDEAYRSKKNLWDAPVDGSACVHRLCVLPEAQGKGIGMLTLRHAEGQLSKLGFKSIKLDVFTENPAAMRLYERAGYSRKGTAQWRKGLFGLMEKNISNDRT